MGCHEVAPCRLNPNVLLRAIMVKKNHIDIAILGGGLSGALIGWALHQHRPDIHFQIFEGNEQFGGSQIWSFHKTDIPQECFHLIEPLIVHRWAGQQVRFPAFHRELSTPYISVNSERIREVIGKALGDKIRTSQNIDTVTSGHIKLQSGESIEVGAVIDCRGQGTTPHLTLGFQKFVGQVIRFANPHGLKKPIIMDADVEQIDGYRFVYVLPYDDHTAMVEDTRYADGADLDRKAIQSAIADYVSKMGWQIDEILSEEEGVLPIALGGDIHGFWQEAQTAKAGMAAALFHPLTGYSLPYALQLANKIAQLDELTPEGLYQLTREFSVGMWEKGSYYRLLCRMLFQAAEPDQRYKVLERFYKLPQPLIERLYAGNSTLGDKARILAGKPPVSVVKALRVLTDKHKSQPIKT